MSEFTVKIKSRLVGSGTFGPPILPVDLPIGEGEEITVATLLERAVIEQVRAMDVQTDLDPEEVRKTFERHYGRLPGDLPDKQRGRAGESPANPGGQGGARLIDTAEQIESARRAFATNRLAIVADGKQIEGMDTVVALSPGSKVTLMRIIQVAGG